MEKKVGNYITIFLFLISSVLHASTPSITMSIYDINNNPVSQVMVNSPFIVTVTFHNITDIKTVPNIPGIDQFMYKFDGRSSNISMYNGVSKSRIVYKFIMQATSIGDFLCGPVMYQDSLGNQYESNPLQIVVGKEFVGSTSNSAHKEKYQLTAAFDKKEVYVGQLCSLKITFIDYKGIDQFSLLCPEFENLMVTDITKNEHILKKNLDGIDYFESEWIVSGYMKSAQFFVADNIKIKFLDPVHEDNFFSQGFFGNFGSMMTFEKELRAQPVGIDVKPLPVDQQFQNVQAVGQFEDFKVSIESNMIEQGQGVTINLDITGVGNLEMIDAISLQLPAELTAYHSSSATINASRTTKHFEYILQALEPGNYMIPAQKFIYFDDADHQYKILYSEQIMVRVNRSTRQEVMSDRSLDTTLQEDHQLVNTMDNDIVLNMQYHYPGQFIIPLAWYQTIIVYLLYIFLCMMVYHVIIKRYILTHSKVQKIMIFIKAYVRCVYAERYHHKHRLYAIFIDLFSQLSQKNLSEINQLFIQNYLKKQGFSQDLIEQWNNFYHKLLQASFSQSDQYKNVQIFKDALSWLKVLKKKA